MKYQCYTDGSSRGNPGSAGWASIITNTKTVTEYGGYVKVATNNQMELMGALNVFKNLIEVVKDGDEIEIYSDSQYVVKGCNDWLKGWVKNNWKNSQKKDVINKEMWQEVEMYKDTLLIKKVTVKLIHVYGHKGHKYNERADKICTSLALREQIDLYKGEFTEYDKFLLLD